MLCPFCKNLLVSHHRDVSRCQTDNCAMFNATMNKGQRQLLETMLQIQDAAKETIAIVTQTGEK